MSRYDPSSRRHEGDGARRVSDTNELIAERHAELELPRPAKRMKPMRFFDDVVV
jgi:hypothetical protein